MSFENYRKAKKGDIRCSHCQHSKVREWSGRLECHESAYIAHFVPYAVGKNSTCDSARAKKEETSQK